jgi:RNA polymerase sigma-54 factor
MGLETKLVQKMGQSLLMTPQLQQAIKLLQLGRLEYKEAIERELLENPMLEEAREEQETHSLPAPDADSNVSPTVTAPLTNGTADERPSDANQTEPKADWEDYYDSFTDYEGTAGAKGITQYDDRQPPEVVATIADSLEQHLLEQVRMYDFSMRDSAIAQNIAGNLTRDGLLECTHDELAVMCNCPVEDVNAVADVMRFFDPIGCCTLSLRECLTTQLEARGLANGLEARIIALHTEKLEKRKFESIAKAEGVTLEEIAAAMNTIRSLEPRPGRPYSGDATRYVIPDAYVQKIGDEWVVVLNEDGLPKIRVNPFYSSMLKAPAGDAASHKAYFTERLRAASWLIKSIHQRQQTIYRVTESIMKFQRNFLENGVEGLRPLVLKDVAEDIEMHESTVSRVTSEKYVHTPRGVFELKFFFTSGIKTDGGSDISSSAVKDRIKAIIAAESPQNPVSDQHIVDLLKQDKIDIARRTIAKYRETLGIPPSSHRKQYF